MPSITPFLWFTGQAEEAADFYVSIFKNSKITDVTRYGEAGPGPAGSVMTVEFELDGQPFMAINAPSHDPEVPSDNFSQGKIALFVSCKTQAELDALWDKLSARRQAVAVRMGRRSLRLRVESRAGRPARRSRRRR